MPVRSARPFRRLRRGETSRTRPPIASLWLTGHPATWDSTLHRAHEPINCQSRNAIFNLQRASPRLSNCLRLSNVDQGRMRHLKCKLGARLAAAEEGSCPAGAEAQWSPVLAGSVTGRHDRGTTPMRVHGRRGVWRLQPRTTRRPLGPAQRLPGPHCRYTVGTLNLPAPKLRRGRCLPCRPCETNRETPEEWPRRCRGETAARRPAKAQGSCPQIPSRPASPHPGTSGSVARTGVSCRR